MGFLRRIPVSRIKALLALAADGKLLEDKEGSLRACEIFMFARWLKAHIYLKTSSEHDRTIICFRSTPLPEYTGVGTSSSSSSRKRAQLVRILLHLGRKVHAKVDATRTTAPPGRREKKGKARGIT